MPTKRYYKDIQHSFCFLDETGVLNSQNDKYFGIGIIKCCEPEKIYNRIRKVRQKYNYNEELKWSTLNRKIRFEVARECFNIFLSEDVKFNCIILNKDELDFKGYFNNDLYKVYQNFSIALLKLILGKKPNELLTILADDYFSPDGTDMERKIKLFTNAHYDNYVVNGVCQIDSKSSDLMQLTDLILGAILSDLKKLKGITISQNTYKRKFLNFIYQKLQVQRSFFVNKFGLFTRNYVLSGDKVRATIFDCRRSTTKKFIGKIKNKPWPTTGDACFK